MSDQLRQALRDVPDEPHVDDGKLARYLDGSLAAEERARVEEHLGRCPLCSEELALAGHVEIEAEALDEVSRARVAARSRRAASEPRPARSRGWLRIAAGLVLLVGVGLLVREAGRLVASRIEPMLVAQMETWSGRDVSSTGAALTLAGGPGIELTGLRIGDDDRFSERTFASAERVALHVEPAALLGGRLDGSIELDRPVVRLVRNALGQWNVETLGGGELDARALRGAVTPEIEQALADAAQGLPPRGATGEAAVELTSASIHDGILEIADLSRRGKALRLEDLDLDYQGTPGGRASVSLEGRLGPGQDAVSLRGEIGPFEGDATPVYRLRRVALQAVPVAEIPGAPASVAGRLSFVGHLESAGRALGDIVAAARGAGEIGLCCGAFEGRNLAHDVVRQIARLPGGVDVLRQVQGHAALASTLAAPNTIYDRANGIADLEPGTLHVAGLEIDTALFRADADASIGLEGHLAAEGSIELAPELAAILLAAAPALAPLADDHGTIDVPIRASGSWDDLQLEIDATRVAARLDGARTPSALLSFARRLWNVLAG